MKTCSACLVRRAVPSVSPELLMGHFLLYPGAILGGRSASSLSACLRNRSPDVGRVESGQLATSLICKGAQDARCHGSATNSHSRDRKESKGGHKKWADDVQLKSAGQQRAGKSPGQAPIAAAETCHSRTHAWDHRVSCFKRMHMTQRSGTFISHM